MADNVNISDRDGNLRPVAGDDIGSVWHQRVKLQVGADGVASDVTPPDGDARPVAGLLPAAALVFDAVAGWHRLRSVRTADGNPGEGYPGVGPVLFNGATFDRVRDWGSLVGTAGSNGLQAVMGVAYNPSTGLMDRAVSAGADGFANPPAVVNHALYNGATFDRERGNLEEIILASAARTATTDSANQENYNARGAWFFLSIDAAGTGNIRLAIVDAVAGFVPVIFTAVTANAAYLVYPGAAASAFTGSTEVASVPIPRQWKARVVHSDGSSWTYSLRAAMVL